MTGILILTSDRAVEEVAHDEQMVVWSQDVITALGMGGFLRDDMEYSEKVELTDCVSEQIKNILRSAFDHPQAKTFLTPYRRPGLRR